VNPKAESDVLSTDAFTDDTAGIANALTEEAESERFFLAVPPLVYVAAVVGVLLALVVDAAAFMVPRIADVGRAAGFFRCSSIEVVMLLRESRRRLATIA
jgi:hypothetical protein